MPTLEQMNDMLYSNWKAQQGPTPLQEKQLWDLKQKREEEREKQSDKDKSDDEQIKS